MGGDGFLTRFVHTAHFVATIRANQKQWEGRGFLTRFVHTAHFVAAIRANQKQWGGERFLTRFGQLAAQEPLESNFKIQLRRNGK